MARYRSGTITIDVEELLDQVDDDNLLEECRNRKLTTTEAGDDVDMEVVREAYDALNRNAIAEARSILDKILNPKWKNVKACMTEFQAAKSR